MTAPAASARVCDLPTERRADSIAETLLADLSRAGFSVTLGRNGYDLVTRPSILRLPLQLFDRLIRFQEVVRDSLRGSA